MNEQPNDLLLIHCFEAPPVRNVVTGIACLRIRPLHGLSSHPNIILLFEPNGPKLMFPTIFTYQKRYKERNCIFKTKTERS